MSIGFIMVVIGIVGAVISIVCFIRVKRADEGEINKEYKIKYDSIIQSKAVKRDRENIVDTQSTELEDTVFNEETYYENVDESELVTETVVEEDR